MRAGTYIAAILTFMPLLWGCEKVWLASDPESDPRGNFQYLWEEIDRKYSYFELKQIDWDEVYGRYAVQVQEDMDDLALFEVLSDMLFELRDGHVNLRSDFNRSRNWDWFLDYPPNFNRNIVYREYLGRDYWVTGPLHNQIIDSVLYIYYESFMHTITESHINRILDRVRGLKGIILDIRHNGGGSSGNANRLASMLSSGGYTYAYRRVKSGPGRADFTSWSAMEVRGGARSFDGKVVLLCNRQSYSSSNLFAQMLRERPNTVLLGDTTGGGGGTPMGGELPNGWSYRFSVTQTQNLDKEDIELGVPVDIRVDLDPSDEAQNIDTLIEEALALFR